MGMLILRHKVKDYSKWRPVFDRHAVAQKAAGLTHPRVFRSSADQNEVVILFDTDDMKKARELGQYAASRLLRERPARLHGASLDAGVPRVG